jgi:hypothetical protein
MSYEDPQLVKPGLQLHTDVKALGYKDPQEIKYGLRGPTVGKAWVTMTHRR